MDNNLNDYTWIAFFNIMTKIISVICIIGCFIAGIIVSVSLNEAWPFFAIFIGGAITVIIYYGTSMLLLSLCHNIYCIRKNGEKQLKLEILNEKESIEGKSNKQSELNTSSKIRNDIRKEKIVQEILSIPDEEDEENTENNPKENECPNCFAKISPKDKECPSCGYKLKNDERK